MTTTTVVQTVRDKLNSNILGKETDVHSRAPLGDILSILLDTTNPTTVVAATTVGAAVTPTSSAPSAQTGATVSTTSAATQTGSYVQADVQTIATLANALKTDYNKTITDVGAILTTLGAAVTDVGTLATRLNQARVDILALRAELAAVVGNGVIGGATETGLTPTSNVVTLSAAPTEHGLITVHVTAGTTTGVFKLVRDPDHTLATGEVYWNGKTKLTFAAIDAVSAVDVIYAKGDLSQKVSCLLPSVPT